MIYEINIYEKMGGGAKGPRVKKNYMATLSRFVHSGAEKMWGSHTFNLSYLVYYH